MQGNGTTNQITNGGTAVGTVAVNVAPNNVWESVDTVIQQFYFLPSTGPFTKLDYTVNLTASAISDSMYLAAYGQARHGTVNKKAGGMPGIQSITQPGTDTVSVTSPSGSTYTDSGTYIYGSAWQPAPPGGGGGG